MFNVAEYCALIWIRSVHCKKMYVQLNLAVRTITGTIRSTPTQCLHVLAHIDHPEVRRQKASQCTFNKIKWNDDLPIYNDLVHHPNKQLRSRHPTWEEAMTKDDPQVERKKRWLESDVQNSSLMKDPTAIHPDLIYHAPCRPLKSH